MRSFLHISDLHFAMDNADTSFDHDFKIRQAIMDDLGQPPRASFDGILVTGDIAYHGKANELARAKAWFEDLRRATNCPAEGIYVVPGNHDVDRKIVSQDSSLWDLHQGLRNSSLSEADRFASFDKKLQDPFDFLLAQADYRAFAMEYDCPTSPGMLAWSHVLPDAQLLEDGTAIRLHGLNTAVLSDGGDTKANLLLGPSQFHQFSSDPGYVNLVLCHHPPEWLGSGWDRCKRIRKALRRWLESHPGYRYELAEHAPFSDLKVMIRNL